MLGIADPGSWKERLPIAVETAIDALRLDPGRTAGALASVAAGGAIIVSLVSIAAGGRREVLRAVEAAGPSNVFLRATTTNQAATPSGLCTSDLDGVGLWLDGPVRVGGLRILKAEMSAGTFRETVPAYAVTAGLLDLFPLRVAEGRLLAQMDGTARAKRAVIGSALAGRLGPTDRLLGRHVRLGEEQYQVVGVLRPISTDFGASGTTVVPDWNRGVLLPLGAEPDAFLAPDRDYPIDLGVVSFPSPARARRGARVLDQLRRIRTSNRSFAVSTPQQALSLHRAARRSFDRVVELVSVLTTFAAGFGIHTLLWTAVRSRGSEIGIRRAVGASSRDIRLQFLAEGLLLGTAGGLIGIVSGAAISLFLITGAGWRPVFEPLSLCLMAAGASACGIASGIRPAGAAARVDPAVALRIE